MSETIHNRTVLTDMDGVLFDFEGSINNALRLEFPRIGIANPSLHFYVYKRYSDPKVVEFIKDTQNSQGFFRDLQPLPGAIKRWREMKERGYTPRICTAPLSENPYCVEEKKESIDHYFGAKAVDLAFIGKDKQQEDGICLIDDRPGLEDGRVWKRVVFNQPYNMHENDLRLNGWQDPNLFSILASCAERYDSLTGN